LELFNGFISFIEIIVFNITDPMNIPEQIKKYFLKTKIFL